MKVLLIVPIEINSPDDLPASIASLNVPEVPGSLGELRVVIDPEASNIEAWLDR